MGNTQMEQKAIGNKYVGLYIDQEIHNKLKADCALKNETIKSRVLRLILESLKK